MRRLTTHNPGPYPMGLTMISVTLPQWPNFYHSCDISTDKNEGWCCRQPRQQASLFTACHWLKLQTESAINYPPAFLRKISQHYNQQHGRRWWIHDQPWHPRGKASTWKAFVEAMDMWWWWQHCRRTKCKVSNKQQWYWCQRCQSWGLTIMILASALGRTTRGDASKVRNIRWQRWQGDRMMIAAGVWMWQWHRQRQGQGGNCARPDQARQAMQHWHHHRGNKGEGKRLGEGAHQWSMQAGQGEYNGNAALK